VISCIDDKMRQQEIKGLGVYEILTKPANDADAMAKVSSMAQSLKFGPPK
jgi:hypothetical protein